MSVSVSVFLSVSHSRVTLVAFECFHASEKWLYVLLWITQDLTPLSFPSSPARIVCRVMGQQMRQRGRTGAALMWFLRGKVCNDIF